MIIMHEFSKIEAKWQKEWEDNKIFEVKPSTKNKKYYVLEMFPYPSASGLHMGHALNYTIGDIFARFKRMNGFNVMYPMGFDAFGLPAENAAIKAGAHPKPFTEKAMENYVRQMKEIGLSYDWSKMVKTCSPEYYKWNQYFFLKFFENGLVYRKKSAVNWCPRCSTVLANEQVHDGKCWRHEDTVVEMKYLEQWFIKTTKYSDELIEMVDDLEWPERIKTMQKNWIGKSHGTEINFSINENNWSIFTTRPDTIYGVTFMVVSAQHPKLMELVTPEHKKDVENFLRRLKSVSEKELVEMDKDGVFTGNYATNPITGDKVPVWAGNFVVAEYGSGMVMAVPAHDQRDFEFAKKYGIDIKVVVKPKGIEINEKNMQEAYIEDGILVNSDKFSGMENQKAKEDITKFLESKGLGNSAINYKFRDWLVSRQRYWGTPIPMVYCDKCGVVPVSEKELPIILPDNVKFGEGNPLRTNESFVNTKCPRCGGHAERETDTMDTFFDSSWYFLRYCDSKNNKLPFDEKKIEYWMPVDQYIGGAEHACMHLIYARFFTKALRDMGFIGIDEPFTRLFNQGMLHGSDGEKMSKSRGNVILPDEVSAKYGMDTARIFLVSQASPDKDTLWSENGIEGSLRIVRRIMDFFMKCNFDKSSPKTESKLNKTIKEFTKDIDNFEYNRGIIKIRALFEKIERENKISRKDAESFLKLLHPICPHITEELWHHIGNETFISLEKWPKANEKKINEEIEREEEYIKSLIDDIKNVAKLAKLDNPIIYILTTEDWKWQSIEIMKKNNGDLGKSIKSLSTKFPEKQSEIPGYVQYIAKQRSWEGEIIKLDESRILKESKDVMEKETGFRIFVNEKREFEKKKSPSPLKPAIYAIRAE